MNTLSPEQSSEEARKIQEAMRKEQEAIVEAERRRVERDERRKKGIPEPAPVTFPIIEEGDKIECKDLKNAYYVHSPAPQQVTAPVSILVVNNEEQQEILEAERRRVERDERKKKDISEPAFVPNQSIPPTSSSSPIASDVHLTWIKTLNSEVKFPSSIEKIKGTILLEGYYTIDDLKKYISLIEKHA